MQQLYRLPYEIITPECFLFFLNLTNIFDLSKIGGPPRKGGSWRGKNVRAEKGSCVDYRNVDARSSNNEQ